MVGCWHGNFLSGARCRLAYGPDDATATHCLLVGFAFLIPANLDASAKNVVILQVMMMDFVVRFEDSHIPVTKTQSVYS